MNRFILTTALAALTMSAGAQKKNNVLSQSFELRYVTSDPKANGETDYKGATEWMDTEQRVAYLTHWQQYASKRFGDQTLDQQVVTANEVADAMKRLKPQPLPQVRQKVVLDEWRWAPSTSHHKPLASQYHFERQTYNLRLECSINGRGTLQLMDGGSVVCEYKNDGKSHKAVFEVDLLERRYNLRLDGQLAVDFQPLKTTQKGGIDGLLLNGSVADGFAVDDIWALGYTKTSDTKRLNQPLFAKTILDASSRKPIDTQDWTCPDYDDNGWTTCTMPKNHGTERHEGEALLLRRWVDVKDFEKAYFELESLFPSGELWINGKVVEVLHDGHRKIVDVTKYLKPNGKNLLALRIDPFHANFKQMMHHCPTDPNIGWFAGRSFLHLVRSTFVSDLYVYANTIEGQDAEVTAEVTLYNTSYTFYKGQLQVLLKDWFPTDGKEWVADSVEVELQPQEQRTQKLRFRVKDAHLWSVQEPQLYQVRALLVNSVSGKKTETFSAVDGDLARTRELVIDKLTDDYVITTGFRTIEQDDGTFRINGQPELLRAPLYFGQRFPLERNALDLLCPHSEDIMKELLAVKKMNGNGMRMSAHWSDDNPQDGTNDPRFTEIADQLGLMFIWQTASWIRLRSPLVADFEGMAEDVRQLRNAPSIVIWQPSNHPSLTDWKSAMAYWHKVYDAIYPNDTTRLITPTADFRHTRVYNDSGSRDDKRRPVSYCDPVWTANRISRGSMDYPTGFGQDWEYLRRWPVPHKWPGNADIVSFLNSSERAYFNFEQEETIGQMNWEMFRGSPIYKYHSYEWDYDTGSIGRLLTSDEWRESQAWQAFSAYECIRKMRWLDYDGLSWCCMWGGGNMGTYQKPLIDALGHKKLAWYAHRMGFQQMLAGSKDVDMVYGPDDKPQVVVMNLGELRQVDVTIIIRNVQGHQVGKKKLSGIVLPAGRSATDAGLLQIPKLADGYYFFEYQIVGK
ncbi:MAG: hypothetical protein IJ559_03120 [Prevotella sp.]|nr:hypothetical protein [Prevotella sp.]